MARRGSDDDEAPWLAEAEAAPRTEVSKRSLFWVVTALLLLVAVAVIGAIMLFSQQGSGSEQGYMEAGQAPLIEADRSPWKVAPADPMGMDVEGQDQTLYAAGAGIDEGSDINLSAGPEAPLPRPGSEPMGDPESLLPPDMGNDALAAAPAPLAPALAAPRPAPPAAKPAPLVVPKPAPAPAAKLALPKPVPAPVAKPVPAPVAKPATTSGSVQLGAFGTAARAETVWSDLRARHGMAGFSRQVSPIERDGKTLYRLRASGGDARATCARLTAAGDACTVVE